MTPVKSDVFNNVIGSPYDMQVPRLTEQQENEILAALFEQVLIFDKITISTNKLGFALFFLIKKLGINTVERLLDSGYIKFMIWSPMIATSTGMQREDGTVDESVIYGMPPLLAGALIADDSDPEKNIKTSLSYFTNLHQDRKKILTKRALKHFIVPNGMEFAAESANLVIDAYRNNNLAGLGLPYEKAPEQLNLAERKKLLDLGQQVIETALLSKYGLKSYENYEHLEICRQNLVNIGKAYNIAGNTSEVFRIENLPNLRALFLAEKMDFDSAFKIRHLSNAKYFRRWINDIGENSNAQEITKEYLDQVSGSHRKINTPGGKLIRNLSVFGVGTVLGNYLAGTPGTIAGGTLGLLDSYWLESILQGKNPRMFVHEVRGEIESKNNNQNNE